MPVLSEEGPQDALLSSVTVRAGTGEFAERLLGTPRSAPHPTSEPPPEPPWESCPRILPTSNAGNPWEHDRRPFSALRRSLGYWKAIGADKSVLSWLAYGYQLRLVGPPRMFFANSPSTGEFEEFVDREIATHLQDGSFVEISPDEAHVVNPFTIAVGASGKPRRCDDMRYVNAFLASPVFKMQTLAGDVPNVVRPGDELLTRDLELQRLTGKLLSLKLAMPSISVWLRELIFCEISQHCEPEDANSTFVEAVEGLNVIKRMVEVEPSAPFVSPLVERDVFVKSGETGWGVGARGKSVGDV